MKTILSLDQGTTSSRSVLFDENGKIIAKAQKEFKQIFPKVSWVEHDPKEIWETQLFTIKKVISESKIDPQNILGIGITNQRETIVAFDSESGEPITNAIVWQCRRTNEYCNELKLKYTNLIKEKTGLEIDAYFSASKMKWILDNVVGNCRDNSLRFATIDSWLVWNLTSGKSFYTDPSNASRTMLFNIKENKYDKELLEIFGIEEWMLPSVLPSNSYFGTVDKKHFGVEAPIHAVLGDQQAALFGQCCFKEGDLKVTYGTGAFLLINTGEKPVYNENFLTTVAWSTNEPVNRRIGESPSRPVAQSPSRSTYALEGSIFIAGAIVQWLRDSLGIINDSQETEKIATSINSNDGVYLVPALVGLGAPYWDGNARGLVIGMTRGTTKSHFVRAALESIAYQVADLILPIKEWACSNKPLLPKDVFLKADGGASKNNFLLQFQADLLQMPITRSSQTEATSQGVAFLAGLTLGLWKSKEEILKLWHPDELFLPKTNREKEYLKWKEAVQRALKWG